MESSLNTHSKKSPFRPFEIPLNLADAFQPAKRPSIATDILLTDVLELN